MKNINKTLITILFTVSLTTVTLGDNYTKTLEAVKKGHTYSAIDKLTELTFDEADKVKLGSIYGILATCYTLQDEKPIEKCENLLMIIPEDMQESIGAGFVKYTAGKISSSKLKDNVKYADINWRALSVLIKYLTVLRDNPDTESLKTLASDYKKMCSQMKKSDWGNLWEERMDKWQDWNNKKTKSKYGLEPLIIRKREIKDRLKLDIGTITMTQYEDLRKLYKKRPQEPSLDFDVAKVKKYIESLPPSLQKMEAARFKTVVSIKTYIVRVLERSPYPNGIKTKKRKLRGTITMANENYLVYKKSTRSRKTERLYWRDLKPEQYSDMMEYYAERRAKISGAGGKTNAEMKKDASTDYFGAAILSDWFGDYENALRYAKKAASYNPALSSKVSEMLLE